MSRYPHPIFDELFKLVNFDMQSTEPERSRHPNLVTTVVDNKYVMEMDLPGVTQDDFDVSVDDTKHPPRLMIEGKRGNNTFSHCLKVDPRYDLQTTEASLQNGVLILNVNKYETRERVKIPVHTK